MENEANRNAFAAANENKQQRIMRHGEINKN